ncbi:MAG: ATP-dependent helicase [Halanaerobiales bacterium]
MISLREGQDEVARYREGYMAVPAVPGAGKTTVLAYLAAELIEKKFIGDGKILIVTYMNSAVANFRNKIGNYLEERGLSRNRGYEVRTLHSLALNILREKPEFLLINDEFQIMDPLHRGRVVKELIDEWLQENPTRSLKYFAYDPAQGGYNNAVKNWKEDHFPRFVREMITQCKMKGLNRDDAFNIKEKLNNDCYLDWALTIYHKYDRYLHQEGMLDFDDLIIKALQLLKRDDKLCQRLAGKYTYIFEDEAQDSNKILAEMLKLLAGKNGNLLRVGDSNQAIMGTFTAADPSIFRSYVQSSKVKERDILRSSRSTEDIIDLANYLVKWTHNEHPQPECRKALEEKYIKPVKSDDPSPNPVTDGYTIGCHTFSTSDKEIKNIARAAAAQVKKRPDKTTAILLPVNYAVDLMAEELEKNYGVDYEKVSSRLEEELKPIKKIRHILYFLAEPHDKNYFFSICEEVFLDESDNLEVYKEFLREVTEKIPLEKLFFPLESSKVSNLNIDFENKYFKWLADIIEEVKLWLEAGVDIPPDELILFLAEKLAFTEEDLAIAQNIALQIRGELDYNPHWKLHDIADEFSRLQPSFEQFARKIYERKGFEPKAGVITITTLHKAKGLEWDTVFLTYLTDNYFPSTVDDNFQGEHYYLQDEYSNPSALARARLSYMLNQDSVEDPQEEARLETIRERLRLLYVGITRAERNLFLSSHHKIQFDTNTKDVNEARPYQALKKYIRKKEGQNAGE